MTDVTAAVGRVRDNAEFWRRMYPAAVVQVHAAAGANLAEACAVLDSKMVGDSRGNVSARDVDINDIMRLHAALAAYVAAVEGENDGKE